MLSTGDYAGKAHLMSKTEYRSTKSRSCRGYERTTLIRRRIDVMVGSPQQKIVANTKYLRISWELLVTNMVITYPAWTIIILKLSIWTANVDIKMQVRDRHADEHWALKRLGGDLPVEKRGVAVHWTVSQK